MYTVSDRMEGLMKKKIVGMARTIICVLSMITAMPIMAEANGKNIDIAGEIYEFSQKDSYEFEGTEALNSKSQHVRLSLKGNLTADGEKNSIAVYAVSGDAPVSFTYDFDDSLLETPEDEWHLVEDKSKKINDITLEDDIQKGALIIQVSNDGEKWISVNKNVNVFAEDAAALFYETTEMELLNGCYYRVIAAYELSRKEADSKILFVKKENFDYKKYVEIFEFYLYDKDNYTGNSLDNVEKVKLGKRIKTENEGYTGQEDIDKDDPHYGWDLGEFFVSGFTSQNTIDDTQYILKNVGDTVTLGFYLNQDIDKLNGKETLSISCDKDGYDKNFEIEQTDFGRGTLIIKYTNPDGETSNPQIYTSYLEANLSPKANTAIRLCEEGDYDVALDYEIQNDNKVVFGKSVFPEYTHYRIAFKFSVRNSNCMVYTFDSVTGSELKNGNVTDNGFYIDLANSQYLDVSVKKEVLEDGADGLIEDTRFNRKAKDKEVYTDDGIYTITVKNKAAELESEKKIYVGTNKILKAYMATGLPIAEIQNKVEHGAMIEEDGTIIEPSGEEIGQDSGFAEETMSETAVSEETNTDQPVEMEDTPEEKNKKIFDYGIATVTVFVILVLFFVAMKKKKSAVIVAEEGSEIKEQT